MGIEKHKGKLIGLAVGGPAGAVIGTIYDAFQSEEPPKQRVVPSRDPGEVAKEIIEVAAENNAESVEIVIDQQNDETIAGNVGLSEQGIDIHGKHEASTETRIAVRVKFRDQSPPLAEAASGEDAVIRRDADAPQKRMAIAQES